MEVVKVCTLCVIFFSGVFSTSVQMCKQYQSEVGKLLNGDCSHIKDTPSIDGGFVADSRELPHMVAIGYSEEDSPKPKYLCNGILISKNMVLTTAHCLNTRQNGSPITVRVGDLDLNSDKDDAQPQDIKISKNFVHPDYRPTSYYNDIGLLQLEEDVKFSKYAYPACLPTTEEIEVNSQVMEVGWSTKSTYIDPGYSLRKILKEVVSHANCSEIYKTKRRLSNGIDSKTQVCASNLGGLKDTCYRGSGGALQKNVNEFCMYTVLGVADFGLGCTAIAVPDVYIKVFPYIKWIEKIAWP